MADEKYIIPSDPAYRLHDIRKVQNGDPANAEKVLTPVIEGILESVEHLNQHKAGKSQGSGPPGTSTPGETGSRYFDTDGEVEYICVGVESGGYIWRLAGATDASDLTYGDVPLDEALAGLEDHVNDKKNPHKVTAADIGAASLGADGKVPASQLPALGGHTAQSSAPNNTNLLWIDTGNGNIIKFYDAASKAWKPVAAVWS